MPSKASAFQVIRFPKVIWLTGLPGAGKSTMAEALAAEFLQRAMPCIVLDGDVFRKNLCSDLGFSREDRAENIRRAGEVAKMIAESGFACIAAFVSPYRTDRDAIRKKLSPGSFVEIYVNAPIDVCERRDPKGLYKKARAQQLQNFTGLSDPYEPPLQPEIEIRTDQLSVADSMAKVLSYFELGT